MAVKQSAKPSERPEPPIAKELQALVEKAQSGDATALPGIRKILDERPEIWQFAGDLAALVERTWIEVLAADNPLVVESMKRTVAEMKADLGGEHPDRLQRLLVDEVVSSWMESKHMEVLVAGTGSASLEQVASRLKRLESAKKRHLLAMKTLASVRSLVPKEQAPSEVIKLHKEGAKETTCKAGDAVAMG